MRGKTNESAGIWTRSPAYQSSALLCSIKYFYVRLKFCEYAICLYVNFEHLHGMIETVSFLVEIVELDFGKTSLQFYWHYLPIFPKNVGSKPRVPRTSGCTVSPKYTGRARDAMPTQKPAIHLPAKIIGTPFARAINKNAGKRKRIFVNISALNLFKVIKNDAFK